MTAHEFPGTDEELFRLSEAANHNCSCVANELTCSAHRMLTDEELAKRLVNMARQSEKLLLEEFKA